MRADQEFLELLACPVDHGDLGWSPEAGVLTCARCGTVFPVRDGIPVLLTE
ncbi:Trm112 family protein [Micromonospora sp. NPDC092111]|uniref:Trm112 family protein n=1 Tax=Micromonospora sp. NPDC092111 TaxID=3364289 RepID=UPI0038247E1C